MKNTKKLFSTINRFFITVALAMFITFAYSACSNPAGGNNDGGVSGGTPQTPVAADYDISDIGMVTFDGSPMAAAITPKTNKSGGAITVWYEEIGRAHV